MLKKLFFAVAALAAFAASPASARTWRNYDGYNVVPPRFVYALPYGYPVAAYADVTVPVPVVTYVPMTVRVYGITPQPPFYNVPPYVVIAPY